MLYFVYKLPTEYRAQRCHNNGGLLLRVWTAFDHKLETTEKQGTVLDIQLKYFENRGYFR